MNNLLIIFIIIILLCGLLSYLYIFKEKFDDTKDNSFSGIKYRTSDNWLSILDLNKYKNEPIKYLEIGTFYGANLISVGNSYGAHPDSELNCIDPWLDYDEYPEYKNEQDKIYNTFIKNIDNSNIKNKVKINRGFSNEKILIYPDEYFDIIYIDGNHEPEYVLEDAVLSFRKVKKNGIIIFDDYGWGGPELTQKGIDAFLSGYYNRIEKLGLVETQMFIKRIS